MVLGFVLYEAADIVYNVSKIGYNSVVGVYNWYYQIEDPLVAEQKKETKRIEELENKIDKLSEILVQSNLKQKIDFLKLKN